MQKRKELVAVLIVVSLFAVVYVSNLDAWRIDDDEGTFLYQVWRMTLGQRPYQDFFCSRDPLFLYTAALWMRLAGLSLFPMRLLATAFTSATAMVVFLLCRETASAKSSLAATAAFLLHPHVVRYGRTFYAEPFFLFFVVCAMYLLSVGSRRGKRGLIVVSAGVLAIATLYKMLAGLCFLGCTLYLIAVVYRDSGIRRQRIVDGALFVLPYLVLFGATTVAMVFFVPGYYDGVIQMHLTQDGNLALGKVLLKGIAFLVFYAATYLSLALIIVPAILQRGRDQRPMLVAWQIPSALALVLLSRTLYPRHLYYLIPSLVILLVVAAEPLMYLKRGELYNLVFIGLAMAPWLPTDASILSRTEDDTAAIVRYIESHTDPGDRVLSDYQELNFHSRRASTYHGAEISRVVVDAGIITADVLISEIESDDVQMVIVDISPDTAHQLIALTEYEAFESYLDQVFDLTQTFDRQGQLLAVYERVDAR